MELGGETVFPVFLRSRAEEAPERIFIQEIGGRELTYADVDRLVLGWAQRWAGLGVGAGDTALVMMPAGTDALVAWLGLGWLRAVEVPVNTAYQGVMLRHIIVDSRANVLLIHESFLVRLVALFEDRDREDGANDLGALETVVVHGTRSDGPRPDLPLKVVWSDEVGAPPIGLMPQPEGHDIATILYTSGTTGPSKGVLVPWAQMFASCTGSLPLEDLSSDDVYYSPFPMFHISGKGAAYWMALIGARLVIRERFDTASFWSDISRYGCTTTLLLGAMANFIYRQPERPDDATTPLRNVLMVPLIPEVEDFKKRFDVRVSTVFNMTEISCPIVSAGWDLANATSCGRVREGYQVRVVDEWDRQVSAGRLGELVVRSDEPWTLMSGYWNNPIKTVEAWRNQWLHTGDGFTYDDDGNFYFVDRQKDAIRRRGENISSFEVEAEVNAHPDVLESAALAAPSEWGEDDVRVVVVLRPGSDLDPESLWRFVEERAPKFMVPRYIEFVGALPKTPTEKVRKAELRAAGISPLAWDATAQRATLESR